MVARVADFHRGGFGGETLEKFFVDGSFDDDAGACHADLALVNEDAEARGVDGVVEVGILENDQRAFAAHFEDDALAALGAFGGDDAADLGGAGEGDQLHARVVIHHLGHAGAVTGHDVEDAGRRAGALHNFSELQADEGRFFGRLEDNGVSAGEGEGDFFHGQHDRKVEGRDGGNDAEGAANRHGDQTGNVGGENFTANAAGFSGDGANQIAGEGNLELGFAEGGTAFSDQEIDHFVAGGFELVGEAHDEVLALGGEAGGPGGLGGVGGVDGGAHVLFLSHENFGEGALVGGIDYVGEKRSGNVEVLAGNVGSGSHSSLLGGPATGRGHDRV